MRFMNNAHRGLKKLLSITSNGYDIFYTPLYVNLTNWIEKNARELSPEAKKNHLNTVWQYGIDALKIRRGYMLPLGSDAETCYQAQEIWTYAVFTVVLIHRVIKQENSPVMNLIESLLPDAGPKWLEAYPSVFSAWNNSVKERDKKTVFYQIEKQINQSRKRQYTTSDVKNTATPFKSI